MDQSENNELEAAGTECAVEILGRHGFPDSAELIQMMLEYAFAHGAEWQLARDIARLESHKRAIFERDTQPAR